MQDRTDSSAEELPRAATLAEELVQLARIGLKDDGHREPGGGPSEPVGWHDPGASHLPLLQAVAGRELVEGAYAEELRERYRWHEFVRAARLILCESLVENPDGRS